MNGTSFKRFLFDFYLSQKWFFDLDSTKKKKDREEIAHNHPCLAEETKRKEKGKINYSRFVNKITE